MPLLPLLALPPTLLPPRLLTLPRLPKAPPSRPRTLLKKPRSNHFFLQASLEKPLVRQRLFLWPPQPTLHTGVNRLASPTIPVLETAMNIRPITTSLLAASLLLALAACKGPEAEQARQDAAQAADSANAAAREAVDKAAAATRSAADDAAAASDRAAADTQQALDRAAAATSEAAGEAKSAARDAAAHASDSTADAAQKVADKARDVANEAKQNADEAKH